MFTDVIGGVVLNAIIWVCFIVTITAALIFVMLITRTVLRNPGLVLRYRRTRDNQQLPFHRTALADGLELVKCAHCSGSTQWLHPETGWGKIPRHMLFRRWNSAEQDYDCGEPIHANLRNCPHCGNLGVTYRDTTVR